jgi:hypothetical protein
MPVTLLSKVMLAFLSVLVALAMGSGSLLGRPASEERGESPGSGAHGARDWQVDKPVPGSQRAVEGFAKDDRSQSRQRLATRTGPGAAPRVSDTRAFYVTVGGVEWVTVADAFGHDNSPVGSGDSAFPVPKTTFLQEGDKDFQIVLPPTGVYTLTFLSHGEPIDVAIIDGVDNRTPTRAVRYLDVDPEAGVKLQLAFTGNGIPDLRSDSHRAGVFDAVVQPTVDLSGPAALDVDGPDLALSISFRGGLTEVTVKASDSGSGVKAIYYSLDGFDFKPYVAPFDVDASKNPTIYVIADDNAANRTVGSFDVPRPPK